MMYNDNVLFEAKVYNFCDRECDITFQLPETLYTTFANYNVCDVHLIGDEDDKEPDSPDYLLTISKLPRNLYELNDFLRCYSLLNYEEKVAFVDTIRETGNPYAYKRIIELIKDGTLYYNHLDSEDYQGIVEHNWEYFFKTPLEKQDNQEIELFFSCVDCNTLVREHLEGKVGFFSCFREDWIQCPRAVLEELRYYGRGKCE